MAETDEILSIRAQNEHPDDWPANAGQKIVITITTNTPRISPTLGVPFPTMGKSVGGYLPWPIPAISPSKPTPLSAFVTRKQGNGAW